MTRWMAFRLYWWGVGQSLGLRFADWCERRAEAVDPNRRRRIEENLSRVANENLSKPWLFIPKKDK